MKNLSLVLNTAGLSVSFMCLLHCIMVIMVFTGMLSSNIYFITLLEEPYNHAILILSGFSLACASQLKFFSSSSNKICEEKSLLRIKFQGLKSKVLLSGGLLLGLSFFFNNIYAEIFVILGAMTLLSMHAAKLLKFF